MSIIEKIYEAYIAGELDIKPDRPDNEFNEKIAELQKQFGMTAEQSDIFEERFLEASDNRAKAMFFAGFKLALELNGELSEKD